MKLFRTIETVADGNYCVGDKIAFTLNDGEKVEALAVKQEDDGMIFYFVDALVDEYHMNSTDTNIGGYQKCELRKSLNGEILDRFPAKIREKMIAFENGDFLRLATEREIYGEHIYGRYEENNVSQWKPMQNYRNRLCFQGNRGAWYDHCWLQEETRDYVANFCAIGSQGYALNFRASALLGVRPVFKIC